jgi:hypothetical protein
MSAIEQYCEAIPGPGGDRGPGDGDRGGRGLPPDALRELERSGSDGRAVIATSAPAARQAQQRAGAESRSTDSGGRSDGVRRADGVRRDQPANDPIAAVSAGFGADGGTVGRGFGTLLLIIALVFVGSAWLRFRGRAQG